MRKIIKLIIGLIIALSILFSSLILEERDNNLKVIFFDVGQGDAILIKTPQGQKILIDGGPDDMIVKKMGKYFSFSDKTIDLMILTHAHSDHQVGLVEVLERFEVKKILYNGPAHTTSEFISWLELIKEKQVPLEAPVAGQEYIFSDDLKLKIVFPFSDLTNQEVKDLNQTSIICQLVYKDIKIFFTGDLPQEEELEILKTNIDIDSDILKVGHHGSKYSSGEEFLKAVSPEWAVIQVGEDNKFNHPHLLTIRKLERQNIDIFRNDQDGDLVIISDGNKFWLK